MATAEQIHAMLDQSSFPHPCSNIKLMETHISWIILTGEFAYKIKKPVDFGFLDFSTLDKREHYCQEEIRLNKRLAPQIYLEVVTLNLEETPSGTGRLVVRETDSPEEYAVKMRQFEPKELYSNLLAGGRLGANDFEKVGEQLACFHSQQESAPAESEWGSLENILYPIEQNFVQIGHRLDEGDDLEQLEILKHWSIEKFEELHPLFLQRKQQGFVRECHGDLHLANIAQIDGEPVLFDCLEFNETFRWIDVINEVAFLVMDLEENNRAPLANQFLNTYLEHTGDYEGVRLLNFYKVYRAMVRAKVNILRLDQDGLSPGEQKIILRNYRNYIRLALSYRENQKQYLAITHGVSGTGKTTAARYICAQTKAIHIRSDVERKRICGLKPKEQSFSGLNDGAYTKEVTNNTFERLETLASVLLAEGFAVVVDATFLHLETREPFMSLARIRNIPFRIIDCSLDEQTVRERIQARLRQQNDASEANVSVMEKQVNDQDFLSEVEKQYAITLDMDKPLNKQLSEIDRLIFE